MIVTKDFDFDLDFMKVTGDVDVDVSGDFPHITRMTLDDSPQNISELLIQFLKEMLEDDPEFSCNALREHQREWDEAERAEAEREYLEEQDC